MPLLGGVGQNTVADAQKDIQQDLALAVRDLAPLLELASTLNQTLQTLKAALIDSKVTVTIQLDKK